MLRRFYRYLIYGQNEEEKHVSDKQQISTKTKNEKIEKIEEIIKGVGQKYLNEE